MYILVEALKLRQSFKKHVMIKYGSVLSTPLQKAVTTLIDTMYL